MAKTPHRNEALEAIGGLAGQVVRPPRAEAATDPPTAEIVPLQVEAVQIVPAAEASPALARRKASVAKYMLYLPPKVARKFKEMAFHGGGKAHDYYLEALEQYLRAKGHSREAELIARQHASKHS